MGERRSCIQSIETARQGTLSLYGTETLHFTHLKRISATPPPLEVQDYLFFTNWTKKGLNKKKLVTFTKNFISFFTWFREKNPINHKHQILCISTAVGTWQNTAQVTPCPKKKNAFSLALVALQFLWTSSVLCQEQTQKARIQHPSSSQRQGVRSQIWLSLAARTSCKPRVVPSATGQLCSKTSCTEMKLLFLRMLAFLSSAFKKFFHLAIKNSSTLNEKVFNSPNVYQTAKHRITRKFSKKCIWEIRPFSDEVCLLKHILKTAASFCNGTNHSTSESGSWYKLVQVSI